MRHLDHEEIGRLLDGNVGKQERKQFLDHLSECKSCLTLYSETMKFIGDEDKNKSLLRYPVPAKQRLLLFGQAIRSIFTIKNYGWALAVVLVILVLGAFLVKEFSPAGMKNAQIKYIEERIENTGSPAFFPLRGEIYTAVRIGIFIEDLALLVQRDEKIELRQKLRRLLSREVIQLVKEEDPLLQELAHLNRNNFAAVGNRLEVIMENHSLEELFRLGRFLEQSIGATYGNKTPGQVEIEKYRQIALKYQLPPGVYKRLAQLKSVTEVNESREILYKIVDVFFR